jgi:hypothetical protein
MVSPFLRHGPKHYGKTPCILDDHTAYPPEFMLEPNHLHPVQVTERSVSFATTATTPTLSWP